MNVVDSSGWLEYFADDSNADFFAPVIEAIEELIVPSITLYEVFRRVLEQRGHDDALQAVAAMQQGRVVDLDASLALYAAQLGFELNLPLADSVILATARRHTAVLWTQDADFRDLPEIEYRAKQR
ncbi:MAG: type II toxin-antitoxin system VapC family toxin [Gemmatimonadales bacterium]|jgi:predicted nucleic acid-binding protein